ncbi:MAG: tRNA (adenosine(37)-N6)-threonylcarbamoyltransferase complex dimerization subunit type 1 TsaB [Alphaproteobacteria bacterium]
MPTLAFDTTGAQCAVALAVGGEIAAHERAAAKHGHAALLTPMIAAVLARAGVAAPQLERVVVTRGPGGFTGIRVGLATAEGLARASGARPVGLTTFEALLLGLAERPAGPVLAAVDSRREPVFAQLFDAAGRAATAPVHAAPAALAGVLPPDLPPLVVVGDAAAPAAAALATAGCAVARTLSAVPDPAAMAVVADAGGGAVPLAPLYVAPPAVTLPAGSGPAFATATPAAADCLAALHRAAARPDETPWSGVDFATLLSVGRTDGLIVVDGDAPAGFVLWRSVAGESEILLLAVVPALRRRGLARALLRRALAAADAGTIWLEVAADNPPAIALYESEGFAAQARRPAYYARGQGQRVDALVLRRDMSPAGDILAK